MLTVMAPTNPIFCGAYKPAVKVSMLRVFTLNAIHELATSTIAKLTASLRGYPRAYYGLFKHPNDPNLPRNILEHPRARLTDDLEVRGWVSKFGPTETLHLWVKLFATDGEDDMEEDEPYKTPKQWEAEGWDISFFNS